MIVRVEIDVWTMDDESEEEIRELVRNAMREMRRLHFNDFQIADVYRIRP
jgi:hypothetical protein